MAIPLVERPSQVRAIEVRLVEVGHAAVRGDSL